MLVDMPRETWQGILDVWERVENDLLDSIVERITKNKGASTTKWQISKLKALGALNKEAIVKINEATKQANKLLATLIEKTTMQALKQSGISTEITPSVKLAIKSMKTNAKNLSNLCNTVMRAGASETANVMTGAMELARNTALNQGISEAVIGTDTINNIISKTIKNMAESGIAKVFDSAGRKWSFDSYVSMDIRTTINNTAHEALDAQARDYGLDVILVSSHVGARPLCAPYQGKCYSMSGKSGTIKDAYGNAYHYESITETSYGEPAGLFGINCKHTYRYIQEGKFVSREEVLETKAEKEANRKRYELNQKQRTMERQIRMAKRNDKLQNIGKTGKANTARTRELTRKYKAFCEQNNLRIRTDRLRLL